MSLFLQCKWPDIIATEQPEHNYIRKKLILSLYFLCRCSQCNIGYYVALKWLYHPRSKKTIQPYSSPFSIYFSLLSSASQQDKVNLGNFNALFNEIFTESSTINQLLMLYSVAGYSQSISENGSNHDCVIEIKINNRLNLRLHPLMFGELL